MPPVMGSAAFIMAEYTGIEYRDIAIAAFLPAVLYYVCVYSQVHFRAVRLGLMGLDAAQIPALSATLKQGGMFLLPLTVLTIALLWGYTPTMVAVYGAITVIVVSWLRRRYPHRPASNSGMLWPRLPTASCRWPARPRRPDW